MAAGLLLLLVFVVALAILAVAAGLVVWLVVRANRASARADGRPDLAAHLIQAEPPPGPHPKVSP